jgi:hypothetical protein
MIHINYPNDKKPPDDKWLKKAEELTGLLEAASTKIERDEIISNNSKMWGEIKEWLETFSHGKCWFTEARNTCCHWQVEHFRPKKEAKDPDRDGYWWLAFDFRNFRLCGGVVNAKKGAFFPLKPGTAAASCPHDNCDDETFLLIDPIRKDDVDLITFSFGGIAVPSEVEGWRRERANESIKRYKLNEHPALLRARAAVWLQCQLKVNELERLIISRQNAEKAGRMPSRTRDQRIESLKRQLNDLTLPRSEFSSVARAYLLDDTRNWVRKCVG